MNRYGYCKGISTKTGTEIKGYYACLPYTTYCFKEDYDAHPDNDREYVITWVPSDWGLPNCKETIEIIPGSMKKYIGQDKNGNEVFEHDVVKFYTELESGFREYKTTMFIFEWKSQVWRRNPEKKTMWDPLRNLWLCEGELVIAGEK